MNITLLGTGTSQGVPVVGCPCAVCHSTDPRDQRFRTSAFVEVDGANILIDAGPDLLHGRGIFMCMQPAAVQDHCQDQQDLLQRFHLLYL